MGVPGLDMAGESSAGQQAEPAWSDKKGQLQTLKQFHVDHFMVEMGYPEG